MIKFAGKLKKVLIPAFCIFHMLAIFWWSLPHSFAHLWAFAENSNIEAKLLNTMSLNDIPALQKIISAYVDLTGSQQYWDFFAPYSPKYHQYLSVCGSIVVDVTLGKITCQEQPLFSNLDTNLDEGFGHFRMFGSDRSRIYRLTENLVKLEDAALLEAFARYYGSYQKHPKAVGKTVNLVLHLFELHPELTDLPKAGYRMDKVLVALP